MKENPFGIFHRKKREELRLSLRKYCNLINYDPGNISKIERGVLPPPQSSEVLNNMASVLQLKGGDEKQQFFDLANISSGHIPADICENADLMESLPVLLRTITGQKLNSERLDELIKIIKES